MNTNKINISHKNKYFFVIDYHSKTIEKINFLSPEQMKGYKGKDK